MHRKKSIVTALAALSFVSAVAAAILVLERTTRPPALSPSRSGALAAVTCNAQPPAPETARRPLPRAVAKSAPVHPTKAGGIERGMVGGVPGGVVGGVIGGVPATTQEEEPDYAPSTESYAPVTENGFLLASQNPLSTFSIDVDTASYAIVRRYLSDGRLPPADAVRIEELVNYFPYDYPSPSADAPFSINVEVAACPWEAGHRLARIGLRGREISREEQPGANLVFLLDVSGSMDHPRKLPLVKSALSLLVQQLDGRDDVAIVVYAGSSGLVLSPTPGDRKSEILRAIEALEPGGGTNGGEGLRLAYRIAHEHLIKGGINRVILATDGDFNLGITDRGELMRLVQEQARGGVSLTALGFGMGNYKDDMLEMLADHGDGNYAYVDSLTEARKTLVEQMTGTLATIAKDVKIQVEFNPMQVGAYRLIGYENRLLRKEEFNDDRKDAGEIGAGHTVTALYEIVPPDKIEELPAVDALKYQRPPGPTDAAGSGDMLTLKLRYKEPDGERSRLLSYPIRDEGLSLEESSRDFRFAAAVAAFGMILRESSHKAGATFDMVKQLAMPGIGDDRGGYRAELVRLVDRSASLEPR